jgi:hypothetical protein
MSSAPASLYHPRPERWPQFSLRGLLIVVTLLGGALGWLGVQIKWIHDRHEALSTNCEETMDPDASLDDEAKTVAAPGPLGLFGEPGYPAIEVTFSHRRLTYELTPTEMSEVKRIERLFPEAKIVVGAWPDPMEWTAPDKE